MFRNRKIPGALGFVLAMCCAAFAPTASAQSGDPANAGQEIQGERLDTVPGVVRTTSEIMQRQKAMPQQMLRLRPHFEREVERDDLEENPDAPAVSTWPPNAPKYAGTLRPLAAQTAALSFDGANLNDTRSFPPDSMGTVGPDQYIVFVNGRLRSFDKTGAADGVLDADPDVFFAPVMTPVGGSVVLSFTSDPQIRYDRFSGRWYLSIIDVPCTDSNCNGTAANRWLLAVSDAASNGTITASTVWTFFYVQPDTTNFCDYPSLGIDVNALYFGCNMFGASFAGTNGYVVQKSSVQGAGPMVVTKFASLGTASSGMYTPRGVDNFDANATVGYFVGADASLYSTVNFRRVSNPGSATPAPTISANIAVTVPTTGTNIPVTHQGNTGGNSGRLDSLDDRFFQAMIRNGHLWTAHNLRVTAAGVAGSTQGRMASRWYDFQNLATTPTLVQSGTVYDNATNLSAAAQYWIPTIAATGQGHAVLGFSKAGTTYGATPSYTGRLSGDTLGSMSGAPGASMTDIGVTVSSYNPPSDTGGSSGRRWGDYSFTVVDPLDDMTVWTVQEYNEATNLYAVRVAKLLAPPPATPTCSASPIGFPSGTGNVTINATSTSGSGFYDPGADLPSPARPFSHIAAAVTNATVNSVTYNSPTQATLNITASVSGLQDVTIINPDGQSVTANGCINVTGGAAATKLAFTTQPPSSSVSGSAFAATVSVEDSSGNVVTTDNSNVTIALAGGTAGAALSGTLTVQAVNGVATFSGLSVDKAGTGYTLHATDASLTPADSSAFNIVAGAAAAISFTTQPATNANVTAGSSITLVAHVADGAGNAVSGESVALAIAGGFAGSTLTATSPQTTNASGDATFSNVSLNKVGTGTLSATDGTLAATSNTFNIVAASPDHLAFTPVPGDIVQGETLHPVTVTEYDAFDNPVLSDSVTQVSLAVDSCGGTVLGMQALTNGAVTFDTTQTFMTVASGVSLSAAAGASPPSAAVTTFDVAANSDILFANGFDACRP